MIMEQIWLDITRRGQRKEGYNMVIFSENPNDFFFVPCTTHSNVVGSKSGGMVTSIPADMTFLV